MEIEIKMEPQRQTPKAIILTAEMTPEIDNAVRLLSVQEPQVLAGIKDGTVEIIDEATVLRFCTENGKVTACTESGTYIIKPRLYELEERLDKRRFVRISAGEIINLKKVSRFDLSLAGTVCVVFTNGSVTYASRRYVAKLKKILGF